MTPDPTKTEPIINKKRSFRPVRIVRFPLNPVIGGQPYGLVQYERIVLVFFSGR